VMKIPYCVGLAVGGLRDMLEQRGGEIDVLSGGRLGFSCYDTEDYDFLLYSEREIEMEMCGWAGVVVGRNEEVIRGFAVAIKDGVA